MIRQQWRCLKFTLQRQMNRTRDACAVGCHSARFLLPFFGATGRDLSSTGRDPSSHRTEHVGALLASSEAFALFMSQGLGARRWLFPSARRRLFPSVRISVCAVALCASCEPASRAKPSMRCEARLLNVYYHEASGDKELRRTLRAEAAAYARRSRPRRTLRWHDCQRASRKLSVHAVVLCA
jgi:hypothetical protein